MQASYFIKDVLAACDERLREINRAQLKSQDELVHDEMERYSQRWHPFGPKELTWEQALAEVNHGMEWSFQKTLFQHKRDRIIAIQDACMACDASTVVLNQEEVGWLALPRKRGE